ncbi:rhomboid family intramembrane serine protease GlpG [Lacimicrobium sp. SS2-24]|uniref:rhomboid family intramembrane serine protease GlpG n=1 Tax=Lacimicrobium sp. SS2-24 TaxID=2005569 RepID=UPI000B4BE3F4|nr:rhomboid family intramembrane serine protease GlpG [Lacimicrobium sp. SS2-24]
MLLIAFSREQDARLLGNYLQQQGIDVRYRMTQEEHPHALELHEATRLTEARSLVEEFLRHPQDQKYQQAAWQQGDAVSMQEQTIISWLPMLKRALLSPVTSAALVICLLVYLGSIMGGFAQLHRTLMFQPVTQLLETHQWWRLLGPAFLHFSALHIVFNLLWWGLLGSQIERCLGSRHLVIIFVLTALLSNYAQFLSSGPNFGGLSGVVYGVMGFVWWCGWLRPGWGLSLSKPLVGFILLWLVFGYTDMLWVKMANTAHTVGLISGCILAVLYTRFSPDKGTS